MITQFFLDMFGAVLAGALDLVPESWNPPGWLVGAVNAVTGMFDASASLGVWFPLDLGLIAAAFLIHAYIGGGLVKAIRILISHFTGGGGSAA